MELTINLASDTWDTVVRNGEALDRGIKGKHDSFNAFVQYTVNGGKVSFKNDKDSVFSQKSLVYPLYYLCSDSDNTVFKRMNGYQPVGMGVSEDGFLEYKTKGGPVSPKGVLEFLLRSIINKMGTISTLILIVPDCFDQPKRKELIDIVNNIAPVYNNNDYNNKVSIKFVNHSTAAVGYLAYTKELKGKTAKVVTLRFESGMFEIGVFKDVSPLSAIPIVNLSDDSIGGIDIITNGYKSFVNSKRSVLKDPDCDHKYKSFNWKEIRNYISNYVMKSDKDIDPDLFFDTDGKQVCYEYNSDNSDKARDKIKKEIKKSIEMCLMLSGLDPSDITYVVSTGPWSDYIEMEGIVKEVFPKQDCLFRKPNDKNLCESVSQVFSDSSTAIIKQGLQTSWGIRYRDQTLLLLDRFTVYPTENPIKQYFRFTPSKDDGDRKLSLYMVSMNSNKRQDIERYDIQPYSVPGEQMICPVDVTVDENGIVSIKLYSNLDRKQLIEKDLSF